ncbi:MAG: Sec-independent protein translocase subunit TatA [Terracoccus sp.]
MADLGWPELSIIVIAFVLMFGWKKMPDMARSLGRSARIFKSEVDEMRHDGPAGPLATPAAPTEAGAPTVPAAAGAPRSWAEAEARATAAEAEAARLRAALGSGAGQTDAA